jgi:hypothetical protein
MSALDGLASYRRCRERMHAAWPEFLTRREARLREHERFGHAAERATEGVLDDLFVSVLDWSVADLNHQVGYADLLLTRLGTKYLIVEAKKPGSLAWSRSAVDRALEQAARYARQQKVQSVAVSDGHMLYAADVVDGGLRDRTFIPLDGAACEDDLWWLSVDGIYRIPAGGDEARLQILGEGRAPQSAALDAEVLVLLHPKYRLPASCFAYVGDATDPRMWVLPYRLDSGAVDQKRLPKAIQCMLTNYRGAHVGRIPEAAVGDVLVRLAQAAAQAGKMPWQRQSTATVYRKLADAVDQRGRLDEVRSAPG